MGWTRTVERGAWSVQSDLVAKVELNCLFVCLCFCRWTWSVIPWPMSRNWADEQNQF